MKLTDPCLYGDYKQTMRFRSIVFAALQGVVLLAVGTAVYAGDCGADPVYERNVGATVTTGARVRSIACMEGSSILATLAVGTRVTVTAETDGWYKVRTAQGLEGWVGQWLLSLGGEPVSESAVNSEQRTGSVPARGLIKSSGSSSVYYVLNGKRYTFPTEKTFRSWYASFSGVVTVSPSDLSSLPLAGNVTYRPGVRLLKINTDPKVYLVTRYAVLRWITSENAARTLFGDGWKTLVEDLPDPFFTNYLVGSDIDSASDVNLDAERAVAEFDANIRPAGFIAP